MRPRAVPVGGDGRTSRDSRSELEGTRSAIVVAGKLGISGVRNRVATSTVIRHVNCFEQKIRTM